MIGLIITSVVAGLLAIGFMVIRVTQKPIYGMLSKAVASVGFIIVGITALALAGAGKGDSAFTGVGAPLIILGLVCGLMGDVLLDAKRVHPEFESTYLTSGFLSFISGHIVYLIAICLIASSSSFGLGLLLPLLVCGGIAIVSGPAVVIISEKVIKANFGKHRYISCLYGAFLIGFTAFTLWLTILDKRFLLFFLGTLFFLISDLVLCQNYFVEGKKEDKLLVVINHTTYYAAQILIACFLFTLVVNV